MRDKDVNRSKVPKQRKKQSSSRSNYLHRAFIFALLVVAAWFIFSISVLYYHKQSMYTILFQLSCCSERSLINVLIPTFTGGKYMQKLLEERWGPKRHSDSNDEKDADPIEELPTDPGLLVLALHKKLQRECGHRGVGRDRRHTDNRKGPSVEATHLHRQLAKAYAQAAAEKFRFPPPDPTPRGKVILAASPPPPPRTRFRARPASGMRILTRAGLRRWQAVWRALEFSCFSQVPRARPPRRRRRRRTA
jgi:hypothetical protein